MTQRTLTTRRGTLQFPLYVPVTTFGDQYPLDKLIQPYLPRLAGAVMVSYHYARQITRRPRLPLMIDSGGFVSLFERSRIRGERGLGVIDIRSAEGTETLRPGEVLEFQEQLADIAFTLDFPIPPGTPLREARRRQKLTLANAAWALANRRRRDLPLYACIQAWDAASARACAKVYAEQPFEGVAIGGLVPRARDRALVLAIVEAVRHEIGDRPLHVLGLGQPDLVRELFAAGVDSVDSSAYVKLAAEGRLWGERQRRINDPTPQQRLHLALCNLAMATGVTLPLSVYPLAFRTQQTHMVRETAAPAIVPA